jgi:hypothetical protein
MSLYAYTATSQTGKSANDLVEFYADASPPFCKTEFKKASSFYNGLLVNV